MSKYVAIAAAAVSIALVWLLWGQDPARDGREATAHAGGPAAADDRVGQPLPAPRRSAQAAANPGAAASAPSDPVALQARDDRRRAVMGPFQGALLQTIDRCLPTAAGPRMPQRLVVRFERVSVDATHEHYKVAAVEPVGAAPGQPPPQQSPAWACIASAVGQPLDIPVGPGAQEPKFAELVAFPLPMSVGWAATPPGPNRQP
ncbi:MAG: hypothetical protein HY902_04515 [Deltaproteobacteria bacterium]|nr:hypothetical protein [Deltaproteobacteria bacterium]